MRRALVAAAALAIAAVVVAVVAARDGNHDDGSQFENGAARPLRIADTERWRLIRPSTPTDESIAETEADFTGHGVRGRWRVNAIVGCAGATVVTIAAG